jgi:hypothetical protein
MIQASCQRATTHAPSTHSAGSYSGKHLPIHNSIMLPTLVSDDPPETMHSSKRTCVGGCSCYQHPMAQWPKFCGKLTWLPQGGCSAAWRHGPVWWPFALGWGRLLDLAMLHVHDPNSRASYQASQVSTFPFTTACGCQQLVSDDPPDTMRSSQRACS